MNIIDLISALILLAAAWNGWRQGVIVQVCSLLGIIAGVWFAVHYGACAGAWLQLDETIAAPGGFVAVLVGVVLVVSIVAQIARRLFHFVGFGILDRLLGAGVSIFKYVLLLGALFTAFDRLNEDYTLVGPQTIRESKFYEPFMSLTDSILPFLEELRQQIPDQKE